MKHQVRRAIRRLTRPSTGKVDFGDFGTTMPVSPVFGFDRGQPVDRYYIDRFLTRHSADIRGRALEIADDSYCRQHGSGITHQDVLHVTPGHPGATIIGDLAQPGVLPADVFDVQVFTQTLHMIFDMAAALRQLHHALKPGGVLLLTMPGISSVDRDEWNANWFWSLTGPALARLLEDAFGPGRAEIVVDGNVYAATAFLQGLAVEDVERAKLDVRDPAYPVIVSARATKGPAV